MFHANYGKPAFHTRYDVCSNTVYSYSDTSEGLPGDPAIDFHNLTAEDGDPLYKDPAGDDFSLRAKSVLRGAGLYLDWMGTGAKKGPQDMGDGSWDEKSAATITVRGKTHSVGSIVTRRNAHRRLDRAGAAPEIGATTFHLKSLIFLVR